MKATIDSDGRVLLPKALGDALGLTAGSTVDISPCGGGVQITPEGRTAQLEREVSGRLVARSGTRVTDDAMFTLIESGRRIASHPNRAELVERIAERGITDLPSAEGILAEQRPRR